MKVPDGGKTNLCFDLSSEIKIMYIDKVLRRFGQAELLGAIVANNCDRSGQTVCMILVYLRFLCSPAASQPASQPASQHRIRIPC